VFHGDNINEIHPTFYGSFGRVVALDGLFLATKGRTLFSVGTSKPAQFSGNWDFYDILYSFRAFKKGFTNFVVPIQLIHHSHGEGVQSDSWTQNRNAFVNAFSDDLPASIN
jgi:hypothetical protein